MDFPARYGLGSANPRHASFRALSPHSNLWLTSCQICFASMQC